MPGDTKNDQQRVCTTAERIKNGSDKILIGRRLNNGNSEENIDKVTHANKE